MEQPEYRMEEGGDEEIQQRRGIKEDIQRYCQRCGTAADLS